MKFIIPVLHRFGDMILSTVLLRGIKNQFPDSSISMLAAKDNKSVIQNSPLVDKIYVFDKNPIALTKLIFQLKLHKFDYLIDPKDHYSSESHLLASLINANYKIGYNKPGKTTFNIEILSEKENENLHFVDRCNSALILAGIEQHNLTRRPELFCSKSSESKILNFTKALPNRKNLLLNISAGSDIRRLSVKKWVEIVNSISLDVNLLVSAENIDIDKAKSIISDTGKGYYCETRNFDELMALVNYCDFIVTADTSVVHIASAFNKPQIALYNGIDWNYKKFAPLSDESITLSAHRGEERLEMIDSSEIISSINKLNF